MGSRNSQTSSLRTFLIELLSILQILAVIFTGWKSLSLILDTPSPIMVVTSESMEPAFQIGDVLFIANNADRVRIGDLPVCWMKGANYPMIHRVIQTYADLEKGLVFQQIRGLKSRLIISGRQVMLTKGDNNDLDDGPLYPGDKAYVYRDEVLGFVRFYVPFVGWPIILAQSPGRWRELVERLSNALPLGDDEETHKSFRVDL